ncbi:hypothetical protein ACLMJK_006359 [Lecanora helva]
MQQRKEIRERARPQLRGTTGKDFFKAWCCGCMDLTQQEKEADHMTHLEKNTDHTEPGKVQGMAYAPQ